MATIIKLILLLYLHGDGEKGRPTVVGARNVRDAFFGATAQYGMAEGLPCARIVTARGSTGGRRTHGGLRRQMAEFPPLGAVRPVVWPVVTVSALYATIFTVRVRTRGRTLSLHSSLSHWPIFFFLF